MREDVHAAILKHVCLNAGRNAEYAIAYALLCIHEVMLKQQELDAADHAQADQIMDWTTTVKGGN